MANTHNFEKLIVKARAEHLLFFLENGFILEGVIKSYFNGSDAHLVTKYLTYTRKVSHEWCKEDELLQKIQSQANNVDVPTLPDNFQIRRAQTTDADDLAHLYQKVFTVYPVPLQNRDYVAKEMNEGTIFYVALYENKLISAASAEINKTYNNAELTDCATLHDFRKHGLMKHLIMQLEKELKEKRIFCAYSLARARSGGMNAVFHQLGYKYTGRLTNNCFIYENLEDMNVWVKDLSKS